jgi:Uma2 family endonuclease
MILPNPSLTAAPVPLTGDPPDLLWRWTVDQYHNMIRAGILTDDDPVELLEGLLVTKMPKNPPHSFVTQYLCDCLARLLLAGWFINVQEPITMDGSEPEPDLFVVRGQRRDFMDHQPGPADVGLAVEVADRTLARDRGMKKRVYARAGIAVYWIVNLVDRQIEVYTEPSGPIEQPDYAQRQVYGLGDKVPVEIERQQIGTLVVAELLN